MHHTLGRLGSNGSLARACRLLPPARVSATAPNRRCSRTTTMAAAGEAIETQQAIVTAAAEAAEAQAAPQAPQQQQQQPDAGDGSSSVQAPPAVKKKVKRNVALHVGYVGTNYSGLQANRELPQLATIEGVLETAIFKAGLISESNYGDFRKTKWSRSSRTDKGVHSLATVIGLRILMKDEDYETDFEGIQYARAINEHLPDDVRVFAVQKTNKSFNARRWCGNRTYEYYLPASTLELDTPDGSSDGDRAKLALLREVLQAFCGYRPYQNYAGNRSQYVGQKEKAKLRREKREARAASEASSSDNEAEVGTSASPIPQQDQSVEQDAAAAAASGSSASTSAAAAAPRAKGGQDEEDQESGADTTAADQSIDYSYNGEGPVPPELLWKQQVQFLDGRDPDDPVVKSHYRNIRTFTADDPQPLVTGGVPCLRLEVCGDSFMLHQIRHMVGTAVAIVRGVMPRELLEMTLSAPGRVTLPRAPPHSLLLYGSQFAPFPAGWGLDTPLVSKYTGERLELREGGQQLRQEFREQVFNAAINELLQHPDWSHWSKCMLPRYYYAEEDVQPAVQQHAEWFVELEAKRAAAKAAAEEAEGPAADKQQSVVERVLRWLLK